MQNLSNENELMHVGGMDGFPRKIRFDTETKGNRQWPIQAKAFKHLTVGRANKDK